MGDLCIKLPGHETYENYRRDLDISRAVQMVEAERTPELAAYLEKISGVVNYVNQTFGLLKAAQAMRPAKLLTPKVRE